nr:hypothetical protein [Tanacetum cinerariifolium]
MKGAPECMRISEFMHGVNNLKLTKRLNEHVPKTMEEMMITTTAFIRGEVASASKKKSYTSWRTHDQLKRQTSEKRSNFRGHPREEGGLAGSPPLQGHQKKFLRPKQIEELVRVGKLSHLIKEVKLGRDQSKVRKKETPAKDKPAEIYMIQSWKRMTRKRVTQSFECVREITFSPLTTSSGAEGPLVIEAKIGRHMIHHMYVDGGSSMEILYEYCFNRLWPEVKNQIVPNKRNQAVPSTAHGMLKFPVDGGIVTICSTILIPAEYAMVITSSAVPKDVGARPKNFKVALHLNFPDQEVAIEGTLSAKGLAEHRLNIREGYSPVRQKKIGQASERAKVIQAEVQKLVKAGIMREVYYHDWLSNPVMGRDQSKVGKTEAPAKDKCTAIYMIQSWQRMSRQKVTQSFERVREITFPSLATSSGIEGPLVIEAEIGGHMYHRMYVDRGSSTEVLYEHGFNRLWPEVKNHMVPATTSLTGFSGETIWPLGQLSLLVTIGDADHSKKAWMNFMIA